MASVSSRDRRVMERQAAALSQSECHESGDDDARAAAVAEADRDRKQWGLPPLKTEPEFHRKAVERGLIRR